MFEDGPGGGDWHFDGRFAALINILSSLILSSFAIAFGLAAAYWARRTLSCVLIAAITLFVLALPWLRLVFSEGTMIDAVPGMNEANAMFALFIVGSLLASSRARGYGAFSNGYMEWVNSSSDRAQLIRYAVVVLLFAWLLRAYRAFEYGILFSGSGNEEAIARQEYIFVVLYSLTTTLAMGAFVCLCAIRGSHNRTIIIFLFLEIVWALVSSGRRDFIFYSFVYIFLNQLSGRKFSVRSLVPLMLTFYLIAWVVAPLFVQTRVSTLNYMDARGAVESVYLGLTDAIRDIYGTPEVAKQVVAENLAERGDAAQFAGMIAYLQGENSRHTYGAAIANSFSWVVPSFVVEKPTLMVEQHIQDFYGMPLVDDAVSWVSVGYADFGYFGCFLYGLLLVLLLYSIIWVGQNSGSVFIYGTASIQACFVAYSIEADPLLAFSSLRDIAILCFAARAIQTIGALRRE